MFKTYDDFVDFMSKQKSRVYSLDNFKRYMSDMDNPQYRLPCVHIGGTNGKGSTTNYIKEVLKEAGYTVATFTSPALYSRLDIIRINDTFIDDETMVRFANQYVDSWLAYELSIFEIEVCIAILYFLEKKVDIALFEVGLGGTLDATNIIKPIVALNTNIGLDHIEYLGNTYQSIASNKAGIVKEGVDYITGETKPECIDVFLEVCKKNHSKLLRVQEITNIQDQREISYCYRGYDIALKSPALYQVKNSALAIETLVYLKEKGLYTFTKQQLLKGIHDAMWAGRFEIMHQDPLIIIDGAHNREGIDAFCACAKKYKNIKIIFSALKDKDTHYMLECLLGLTNDITVCPFEHVRAASTKELINGFDVLVDEDYKHALNSAFNHQGVVFITGSLYFIALVRAYIKEKKEESTL